MSPEPPALAGRFFTTSTTWEAHSKAQIFSYLMSRRTSLKFTFSLFEEN